MLFATEEFEFETMFCWLLATWSEQGTWPLQAMVFSLLWYLVLIFVKIWNNLYEVIACILIMKKTCYLNWRNLK